ncbi:SRPBCC family protein [Kordia sp.]|uniref:SRPBCC family protein n=1 Tax=Kordia sp. TaxID=1965332 RepID=UPI003D6C59D7
MSNLENRTITIERTFNAPLALVWDAWTQPEHIASWWAPNGMKLAIEEHNFTVGGKWKFSMPMPDGNKFISEGVYTEIVPQEKIVFTADFKPMTENVEIHVHFKADGNTTNFTFHVIHETEEYCRQQEKMGIYNGWGSAFDRLEGFLES